MKKTLFIAAAAVLLLAFVSATLHYTQQRDGQADEAARLNQAALERPDAPTLGPSRAKVRIVEFLDPACETCKRFYPFVKDMLITHPERIHLTLRYAPFHEGSDQVVALLLAAAKQGKHWETLEVLLESQRNWVTQHVAQLERVWPHLAGLGLDLEQLKADMADAAIRQHIARDLADAQTLNVTKTPEFFVNGQPLAEFGYEPLKALVDAALARTYPQQ